MAEDGRKERGKGRTIFIWERKNDSSITWESKMLHAIQQVAFFSTQWVLINTEGIPFWTINGEGFHRSDPEKSIIVFTNQRLQRFMSPLQTALTWAYWWTIILYPIEWIIPRGVTVLMVFHGVTQVSHVIFQTIWNKLEYRTYSDTLNS